MESFYIEVLDRLLSEGILTRDMRILVVCAGQTDKDAFLHCGFRNVVISNLDSRMKGNEFSPFEWSFQDAENLAFEDDTFDFCVVHSGLHHCYSPHRGMLEMYRVSKLGLLLFEPYDNILTRIGIRLKFGQEYEHSAVFHNGCAYGGVKNSSIPNYVYRMTKQEIVKAVTCFAPYGPHRFKFIHRMRLPFRQLKGRKQKIFYFALLACTPFLKVLSTLFPEQCNNFAAIVRKPAVNGKLHPWLRREGEHIALNKEWLEQRYQPR